MIGIAGRVWLGSHCDTFRDGVKNNPQGYDIPNQGSNLHFSSAYPTTSVKLAVAKLLFKVPKTAGDDMVDLRSRQGGMKMLKWPS